MTLASQGSPPGGRVTLVPLPVAEVDPSCPGRFHADHPSAYTRYGCRCLPARRSYARYRKALAAGLAGSQRRVMAVGTRRRLRALAAKGWSLLMIAQRTGIAEEALRRIRTGRAGQVSPRTAQAVIQVYDLLWDTPGPSRRSVQLAERMNWPPPMWWDDDQIDNPRARGPERRSRPSRQEMPRAG